MRLTLPNEQNESPSVGEAGIPQTSETLFGSIRQSYQQGLAAGREAPRLMEAAPPVADINIGAIPMNDEAFYTKISLNQNITVRNRDPLASLLGKLLNLFISIEDKKKIAAEVSHNFDKEREEKSLKQHIEIVEAFGGESKFSKVEKKKRSGTGILGKLLLGASLLAVSDVVMGSLGDTEETAKGFSSDLESGISNLWTIAKDEIDKFVMIKDFSEFTAPMTNWLHDQLSGLFGKSAVDLVFKKTPEKVDKLTPESAALTSSIFPATETPKMSSSKKDMMKQVFNSFKKAGFSDDQAIALTSEVGRENNFEENHIFGTHKDAANAAVNVGFFSWQGTRKENLMSFMGSKGLLDKEGGITHTQESLDAMAEFSKKELTTGPYDTGDFLENKNIDSEVAAFQLGHGYIKWAIGQSLLKNGKSFDWESHNARRRGYSNVLKAELSSKKTNQPEQSPYVSKLGDALDKSSVENKDMKKTVQEVNSTTVINNNTLQYINPVTNKTEIMTNDYSKNNLSLFGIY